MSLDNKINELIAIGASISANCQPCLEYHTRKARENGSDEKEIIEAIEVGKLVRRGAAAKMDKFAENISQSAPLANEQKDKDCGCGK